MIAAENLSRVYHMGAVDVRALDGVSFEIGRGEFVGALMDEDAVSDFRHGQTIRWSLRHAARAGPWTGRNHRRADEDARSGDRVPARKRIRRHCRLSARQRSRADIRRLFRMVRIGGNW